LTEWATSSGWLPPAAQVAFGAFHACALVDGGVYCWGNNGDGELGNKVGFVIIPQFDTDVTFWIRTAQQRKQEHSQLHRLKSVLLISLHFPKTRKGEMRLAFFLVAADVRRL